MPLAVPYNGATYTLPLPGENYGWGGGVTSYLQAVSVSLAPGTGTFILTSELDFGGVFGIKADYYKSRSAIVSSTGNIRLARTDAISFRNNANSADLPLTVNASNNLTFNGAVLGTASGTVTSVTVSAGSSKLTSSGSPITSSGTIVIDVVENQLALNNLSGTLSVSKGGSGATSLTGYLIGNGTSAFTASSTIPTSALSGFISLTTQVTGTLAIGSGGTGQITANNALNALLPAQSASTFLKSNGSNTSFSAVTKTDVGLSNVDNTSDVNKPVSTAQAAAIAAAVPLTTQGDLFTRNATVNTRLAVGATGQILTGDTTSATKMSWQFPNRDCLYFTATATAGGFATFNNTNVNTIIIDNPGAGAIATFTVELHSSTAAFDGLVVRFSLISTGTGTGITALTVTATGCTVVNPPASMVTGQGYSFIYIAASTSWVRLY